MCVCMTLHTYKYYIYICVCIKSSGKCPYHCYRHSLKTIHPVVFSQYELDLAVCKLKLDEQIYLLNMLILQFANC